MLCLLLKTAVLKKVLQKTFIEDLQKLSLNGHEPAYMDFRLSHTGFYRVCCKLTRMSGCSKLIMLNCNLLVN